MCINSSPLFSFTSETPSLLLACWGQPLAAKQAPGGTHRGAARWSSETSQVQERTCRCGQLYTLSGVQKPPAAEVHSEGLPRRGSEVPWRPQPTQEARGSPPGAGRRYGWRQRVEVGRMTFPLSPPSFSDTTSLLQQLQASGWPVCWVTPPLGDWRAAGRQPGLYGAMKPGDQHRPQPVGAGRLLTSRGLIPPGWGPVRSG